MKINPNNTHYNIINKFIHSTELEHYFFIKSFKDTCIFLHDGFAFFQVSKVPPSFGCPVLDQVKAIITSVSATLLFLLKNPKAEVSNVHPLSFAIVICCSESEPMIPENNR